jgi:plasmid maintenance system antidote protein VapI
MPNPGVSRRFSLAAQFWLNLQMTWDLWHAKHSRRRTGNPYPSFAAKKKARYH